MSSLEFDHQRDEVAIIGMAGRFPGARNVDEFWRNIQDGVESIKQFTIQELQASGIDEAVLQNPAFVNAGAVMDDAEYFDAAFFGYTAREAEIMDPQHRAFLECAWEALEYAGYDPEIYSRPIGVFGGVASNTYFQNNLITRPDLLEMVGHYPVMIGSEREYAITRVSFKLNLKGPSLSVNTACSTSGVAIHLAFQSLLSGECDMALAGGARIKAPLRAGYLYQEDGILSPDGHCRAFDAKARGTVVGSGVAMIVMKRLSDAIHDGDTVHAVIKGTAINNDGALKIGFTAPSAQGQAAVITEALAIAEVSPDTIGYVEAHGTGTFLGDPIEVAALTKAFSKHTDRKGYCAIGSLKTNIGHLDAGAGVAGVIKAALALKHKRLPPSLNFEQPNPQIDFDNSPFYVNDRLAEWPTGDAPRRAGVSSFGLGGTNAHIILEEPPENESSGSTRPYQLLLLSAKSESALKAATSNLAAHLRRNSDLNLGDVAYTLQIGRRRFQHRRMVVCHDAQDALSCLEGHDPRRVVTQFHPGGSRSIVFMFPGGGAQYINMAVGLYKEEQAFRTLVDQCVELLRPQLGLDLRSLLYAGDQRSAASSAELEKPSLALPALFTIEYALAKLWMSWGLQPVAMIGHSLGEYTAACLAGVISLEDGLALVALRGRLFEQLPAGSMLAVPLSEDKARTFMSNGLAIAAVNRPDACVISGSTPVIEQLQQILADQQIDSTRLHISVAAHSQHVEPILDEFSRFLKTVQFKAPSIPYVSNISGAWITTEEATDPEYWVEHLRQTVRFSDGLQTLLQEPDRILLEVGPGQTLSTFARQHPAKSAGQPIVASLRHPKEQTPDLAFLLNSLGRLWLAGAEVDWTRYYAQERRRRVPLPTYPFERKRYWIEPASITHASNYGTILLEIQGHRDQESKTEVEVATMNRHMTQTAPTDRKNRIVPELQSILHDLSGIDLADIDIYATFLELGFDSLFLTQASMAFQKRFKVKISFRQLFETAPTLDALALYIDSQLPAEAFREPPPQPTAVREPAPAQSSQQRPVVPLPTTLRSAEAYEMTQVTEASAQVSASTNAVERIINQQLQLMAQQLEILRNGAASTTTLPSLNGAPASQRTEVDQTATHVLQSTQQAKLAVSTMSSSPDIERAIPRSHGPWKPIDKTAGGGLTPHQQKHLDALIDRFTARTKESKRLTQAYRARLADPRTVAGFRLAWKEIVYPIVVARSSGSKLWDVDGNEWVDITMGFGVTLFGHSPSFIVEAVERQLKSNIAIGPQTALAGQAADLLCELTGLERVAFCNTGSEAVLAAIRVSRTVTGRERIAVFSGSYHGIFDEVLVKGVSVNGAKRSMPVAPGIPQKAVEDVLVLDYGDPESLKAIEAHAHELAAVLVEPVQSRHPELQPKEFLHSLRDLTEQLDIPLIFDEMITGFRLHPGGAQAWFGVKADIATYGKVIGGGIPIGAVAGKARYLDALDGGTWNFGDDSAPEAGVTWFAGTFVRHPIAMAATYAALNHLKQCGTQLQEEVNEKTARFATQLNEYFAQNSIPIQIAYFSSLFLIRWQGDQEFAGLFWHYLRDKGIHCHEGRPNFLTVAHTEADLDLLARSFQAAAAEMQAGGFLAKSAGSDSLQHVNGSPTDPLEVSTTEEQMELWLACQLGHDASCGFNLSYSMHFKGPFQLKAMRTAIQRVIDRHEALRMTVSPTGESLRFARTLTIEIPLLDLAIDDKATQADKVAELLSNELETAFDLIKGPLICARIIRLAEDHHLVLFAVHHLACDGFSAGILIRELAAIYSATCQGSKIQLADPMQYSEYALWQHQQRAMPEFAEAEQYWLSQCSNPIPPPLNLPTDRPRPQIKSFRSAPYLTKINRSLSLALKRTGTQRGCTMFSTLLSGFALWLHRLTGQDDVVIGIPASGQSMVGRHDLVGHCAHHHPFRSRISWDQKTSKYLTYIQSLVLDAYEHRNYTEGSLLKKLRLPRDLSRLPLINVQFNMDPAPLAAQFHGLEADISFNGRHYNFPDMTFNLVEFDGEIIIRCEYNTDLFDEVTIRRRLEEFEVLLAGIVAEPDQVIAMLPILPEAERQQVLVEWNETQQAYPQHVCLHQLFEAQVERTPDAIAVSFEEQHLTYQELNCRANQLAHHLRGLEVGPEVLVGICMERSLEMVIALLGTLKAGGAYVPLDSTYPKDRLAFMLADTQAPVLLTQQWLVAGLPEHGARVVCLDTDATIAQQSDQNPASTVAADHLAYVIYTSGSTGKPKGVMITHRALHNHMQWMQWEFPLTEEDRVLQKTPFSFDASVWEFYAPLFAGAQLIMALPGAHRDPADLIKVITKYQVSTLQLVPSLLQALLEEPAFDACTSLKRVFCGGEVLSLDLQKRFFSRLAADLYNLYGPTEATIDSTFWICKRESNQQSIPVGRPIANAQVYLLNSSLQPVPIGVPGELHIGGDGLARGYLNRPDLTAEKFIHNPFSDEPGARLYKTGDLARYLPDGTIEFQGRLDHQVKIRGFRIEPGEIEAVLVQHPTVQQVVVLDREDELGEKRLMAYVVSRQKQIPTITELRRFLKEKLPDYMVPSAFVMLDAMPLTPNGKVDRHALPAPDDARPELEETFVPPQTPIEKEIASIWAEVLGLERVGVHDNFFDLGGHSLRATQVIARLHDSFHVELPFRVLFEAPTVASLALTITQMLAEQEEDDEEVLQMISELKGLSEDALGA